MKKGYEGSVVSMWMRLMAWALVLIIKLAL